MTRAQPRRRGRPRAYDPDVALRRARDTFWRAGYAATSLDDLAAGMGMNRPSIYAAFGDKRALYLTAQTDDAAPPLLAGHGRTVQAPAHARRAERAAYR